MKHLILPALACLALAGAGCGGGDDNGSTATESSSPPASSSTTSGGTVTIAMKNIQFAPKTATVKVGQKVKWVNQDTVDHDVKAEEGAKFQSETFGQGGTYEFTPKEAADIKYVCTLHPGMDGELKVVK